MPRGTHAERAAYAREYYSRPANAFKNRARIKCKSAIESGKLARLPCEKCGNAKTQAHHDDYSKPLDVRWLCSNCHGIEHRKEKCKHGHELTPENVRIKRRRGCLVRICRACQRRQRREAILRKQARQ